MNKGALITLAALTMTGAGCSGVSLVSGMPIGSLKGSGKPLSKTFEVKDLKGLRAGGAFQITVTPDSAPLVVSCDDNLMPHLVHSVEGGILSLGFDKSVTSKLAMTATVGIRNLESLDLAGACGLKAAGVKAESLDADLSGAANADLSGTISKADLTISGSSSLVLDAAPQEMKVDVSGASELEAKGGGEISKFVGDLTGASHAVIRGKIDSAEIRLSGASTADLDARALRGSADGASELLLRSKPEEEAFETSGASSKKLSG